MTIVVENGSQVPGANSYVSEAELTDYATSRGVTLTASAEVLLLNAMDYIESLNFIGVKASLDQPLQWPRFDVVIDGYLFPSDAIPDLLKNGLMQTAMSIDAGTDPLSPIDRPLASATVGPVAVTWEKGQTSTIVRKITAQLRKLIRGVAGASFGVYRGG